jgi:hypothetical protein
MKKLQERLKAGIDFNPKKDPCYDSIVEEAETILGHVLDAAEGKEIPYKNFTVGGGYDERKDREIIIVRGDGEDLLVMEVKDESIRVQPHERHAVTLNEDDEASAREIFDILMKMKDQRQGSTFKVEEGKKAMFEFLKDVSKAIGADVETPEELLKALKNRQKDNEDDIEDLMREQCIHLTMHMLDCSREKAEKIVKNFEALIMPRED